MGHRDVGMIGEGQRQQQVDTVAGTCTTAVVAVAAGDGIPLTTVVELAAQNQRVREFVLDAARNLMELAFATSAERIPRARNSVVDSCDIHQALASKTEA